MTEVLQSLLLILIISNNLWAVLSASFGYLFYSTSYRWYHAKRANLWLYIIYGLILACNCPIPFLAQNDGESIGNLNYIWHQVSMLRMRGMENMKIKNFFLLSVNKNNAITDVWLTASVKKLPTLAPPCCVKKCSTCIRPYYASNYVQWKGRMHQSEIFQERIQSFLHVLQCVIITSIWNYLKLQNATRHEKHSVFDSTIHFPKFSFILILRFICLFGIIVYAPLSLRHFQSKLN